MALSYGFSFLDIDGVIPYDRVSLKYACEVYGKPWSLWSCNFAAALFLSFRTPNRIQDKGHSLLRHCLVGQDTVVMQVTDYGQGQDTFLGVNIGDIYYPFCIWLI